MSFFSADIFLPQKVPENPPDVTVVNFDFNHDGRTYFINFDKEIDRLAVSICKSVGGGKKGMCGSEDTGRSNTSARAHECNGHQ